MLLLVLLACAPEPGTYFLETTSWSTTCSLGGGGFEEPAAQYLVEVYVESDTELWLDDNACTRSELDYACADEPLIAPLDAEGESVLTVSRAWSGAWTTTKAMQGEVSWTTACEGPACSAMELCDAAWSYQAVNVDSAS